MPLADRNAGLQQKGADLVDGRVCWLADAPSRTWLAALGARLRMPKHSRGARKSSTVSASEVIAIGAGYSP
jgi:hypothetical protein